MNTVRLILGVIVGYVIFAASAVLLFKLLKVDPHADPSLGLMIITIAYGIAFGFLGGLAAQLVAGTRQLAVNYILASIIAGFAAFSWFKTTGNHYTQVAAVFLFAPASLFGGVFYSRRGVRQ